MSCVLFPIGATCELLLVLHIAMTTSRIEYSVLSCLWPMGFLPLMRRLLKQRANHTVLVSKGNEKKIKMFLYKCRYILFLVFIFIKESVYMHS